MALSAQGWVPFLCLVVDGWAGQAVGRRLGQAIQPLTGLSAPTEFCRGFLVCKHGGELHLEYPRRGRYTYKSDSDTQDSNGVANNAVPAAGLPLGVAGMPTLDYLG